MSSSFTPFPLASQHVNNALLLATLPSLSTPHFLTPAITSSASHARQRLVIVLLSRFFNLPKQNALDVGFPATQGISHTESWPAVHKILTFVYVQATKVAMDMGKVLMDIDIQLKGLNEDLNPELAVGMDLVCRVSGDSCAVPLPLSFSSVRQCYIPGGERHPISQEISAEGTPIVQEKIKRPSLYPVTALGGTFDHLHAGHKILLSMGAWITRDKLIVGITDDVLLQSKSNKHVLENLAYRTERVRNFLHFFKPELQCEIVPINDVYGPTGWDPNVQALVVSKETKGGASAIAAHRKSKNLPELETFIIDVISATSANLDHEDAEWLKQEKLSSTFIRQWIVDQSKQEEEENEEDARK